MRPMTLDQIHADLEYVRHNMPEAKNEAEEKCLAILAETLKDAVNLIYDTMYHPDEVINNGTR